MDLIEGGKGLELLLRAGGIVLPIACSLGLWFDDDEVFEWTPTLEPWVLE